MRDWKLKFMSKCNQLSSLIYFAFPSQLPSVNIIENWLKLWCDESFPVELPWLMENLLKHSLLDESFRQSKIIERVQLDELTCWCKSRVGGQKNADFPSNFCSVLTAAQSQTWRVNENQSFMIFFRSDGEKVFLLEINSRCPFIRQQINWRSVLNSISCALTKWNTGGDEKFLALDSSPPPAVPTALIVSTLSRLNLCR